MSRSTLVLLAAIPAVILAILFLLLLWNHLSRTALARRRRRLSEQLSLALLRWERGASPEALETALERCTAAALYEVLERHYNQLSAARARALVEHLRASDWLDKARALARSPFWWRRQRAAELLGYMGRAGEAGELERLLTDGHPAVAAAALLAARRLRLPELLEVLLDAVEAVGPMGHRRFLLHVLLGYGPRLADALSERLRLRGDPEAQVARLQLAGRLGLAELGAPVRELLRTGGLEVRVNAARALASFPPEEATEPLRSALRDPAWEVRVQAASGLGRLEAAETIPDLRRALGDPSWWVRLRAALALRKMGDDGRSVLEAAGEGEHDDLYAREMASFVLSLDPAALQAYSR